jgi:uncharacterized protein
MAQQYLYRIQPSRPEMLSEGATPEEEAIVAEHFAYLERLTGEGVVLLAGRTLVPGPQAFGIVIFLAEDDESARQLMAGDPVIRKGVMLPELFPFRISLASKTLAQLSVA